MVHREKKLLLIWALLTSLAIMTQAASWQFTSPSVKPAQIILGDSCPNTCPQNAVCIAICHFDHLCCEWDWGCWLNPWKPDYQISWCFRIVYLCSVGNVVVDCCSESMDCVELNGAPCCNPIALPCP